MACNFLHSTRTSSTTTSERGHIGCLCWKKRQSPRRARALDAGEVATLYRLGEVYKAVPGQDPEPSGGDEPTPTPGGDEPTPGGNDQPTPTPGGDEQPAPEKKGCRSSIIATSTLISLVSITGVILLSKKRKEK